MEVLFALAALGFVYRAVVRRFYSWETGESETLWVETRDHWRLAMGRYKPTHLRFQPPVLLLHGLSTDRYTFDLHPERSLARTLAAQGFDVFVAELRGHGRSECPTLLGSKGFEWGMEDYLASDLPAILHAVERATGETQVHWVGHSMGGILLYGALGRPELRARIRSGVAVASSLHYGGTHSGFEPMLKMEPLTHVVPALPVGELALLFAPFAGRFINPGETFNYRPENMVGLDARRLHAQGFRAQPSRVLQDLIPNIRPTADPLTVPYARALPGNRDIPILALGATRDEQCPEAAARKTFELLPPGAGHRYLALQGYGHIDLLCGKEAPREVFLPISSWLEEHSHSSSTP
jgi:pimeloyl-ACP methyl ester carboxylesterase